MKNKNKIDKWKAAKINGTWISKEKWLKIKDAEAELKRQLDNHLWEINRQKKHWCVFPYLE